MRTLVIFSLLVLSFSVSAQNAERNMLLTNNSVESLSEIFLEPDAWIPYPKDADEWKVIVPDAIYRRQIESAEAIMAKEYPVIKATVFLDYVRNGNRNKYQNINFERRQDLSSLVIAEMLEGKNRFVDDILNLVWAICEESYWGVPAHLNLQDAGHGLPDVEEPSVDLFASETVALLAWTDFMIGDKLDLINPLIRKRIYYEANTRIFNPYLSTTKYKYMGYNKDIRRPNNWNPWINSNVMLSVLLLEKDKEKRAEVMYKSFEVLDNYLNPHPADGGCDEGPSYWGRAGASVFDCLDVLNLATAGKINLFSEPLIKNMGTYIYKAYIGKGYFLNFADAGMKVTHSPVLIYRYGKAIQSQTMMEMAAFFAELRSLKDIEFNGNLGRAIPGLYYLSEVLNQPSKEPLIRDFWLPDIQVMGARDMENSDKGFFMAVKGGHTKKVITTTTLVIL